jgi:hypothetical protein
VAGSSTVGVDIVVGRDVGCDFVSRGSRDNVAEAAGNNSETEESVVSPSGEGSLSGAEVGVQARTVTAIIIAAARTNPLRINNRHSIILQ